MSRLTLLMSWSRFTRSVGTGVTGTGMSVGTCVGNSVGTIDVGPGVGPGVGTLVGASVGTFVGRLLGAGVRGSVVMGVVVMGTGASVYSNVAHAIAGANVTLGAIRPRCIID